jgi:Domain of unknown function (DUF5615)
MKLLFDQNLSPRLVRRLADLYPGSEHVFNVGLERADDVDVWNYAREQGFMIARSAIYSSRSTRIGSIWLARAAGTSAASEPTARTIATTPASVKGSEGETP